MPPANDSSRLSISGSRTTRDRRAPSAIDQRLAPPLHAAHQHQRRHVGETMSSAHPVTSIRISSQCWYCSRMLVMPAPPGAGTASARGAWRDRWRSCRPSAIGASASTRAACALRRTQASLRPDAPDQRQPVGFVVRERRIARDRGLGIRAAERSPAGRCGACRRRNQGRDPDNGERLVVQIDDAANE